MKKPPRISFVLATHNRREVVEHTLARLGECGLDRRDYEIVVVDNASSDGTPEAAREFCDTLIRRRANTGSCAKAFGVDRARGEFIVFLDDDSHPRPGSVEAMIRHFESNVQLASAGFTVHLPDGRRDCAALPGVFVGCGVGLRAKALRAVGGLDRGFFMQAEEYDLCFRLVNDGWHIANFDDLHAEHVKSPVARQSDRTVYYDIRNNLCVAARYLAAQHYSIYKSDWITRYRWLAHRSGQLTSFRQGLRSGALRAPLNRIRYRNRRLGPEVFEFFFRWGEIRRQMADIAQLGVRRILIADLGKNVYCFYQAAKALRMDIVAVADDRFALAGRSYRGVPLLRVDNAVRLDFDAVVVGNMSAVQSATTWARLTKLTSKPVHGWFGHTLDGGQPKIATTMAPTTAAPHRMETTPQNRSWHDAASAKAKA